MCAWKGSYPKLSFDEYTITVEGEIINNRWHRKVKPQPNNKGYLRVFIAGKMYFVHRLVAEKYIPNPYNKPQVNHKDGNKLNNRADNLEWVTNQENRNHAIANGLHLTGEQCSWSKLTQANIDFIREHTEFRSTELARMFNVGTSHISAIRKHKIWK